MICTIKDICKIMNDIAPPGLAMENDNIGLLIGNEDAELRRILLTLDVNMKVVYEAVEKGADLIISHHPLFMKAVRKLTDENFDTKIAMEMIKNNISLFTAHTNLDFAIKGVNDTLASKLGLIDVEGLTNENTLYKIAVFVPESHIGEVQDALCSSGAGNVGKYSHCTFQSEGRGQFKPLEGSSPYIGSQEEISIVEEIRLETIVPQHFLNKALKAMLEAHPYEEVAYDVYLIKNTCDGGVGRIGDLIEAVSFGEFCKKLANVLGSKALSVVGKESADIKRVALIGGSAGEHVIDAKNRGADVFITGEMKHHEKLWADDLGICAIEAGHYLTENPVINSLFESLQNKTIEVGYNLEVLCSDIVTDARTLCFDV